MMSKLAGWIRSIRRHKYQDLEEPDQEDDSYRTENLTLTQDHLIWPAIWSPYRTNKEAVREFKDYMRKHPPQGPGSYVFLQLCFVGAPEVSIRSLYDKVIKNAPHPNVSTVLNYP